jgi:oligopeptide transport system substrate-binding protein
VRNSFYKSPRPAPIDRIRYMVTDDRETGLKRFLAGELDWTLLPPGKFDWAKAEHAAELHSGATLGVRYLFFNVKSGRFAGHPKLREALALALDREVIAEKVDRRGETPAYGWTPPAVIPGYTPPVYDWQGEPMAARLERARKLLAEEGFGPDHPLAVTINYPTRDDTRRTLLAVANMWKTGLGVEVTLSNEEWRVFIARQEQFDFEIGALARTQTQPDAGIFLEPFLGSAGGNSDTGYANPEFDRLMTDAEHASDPAARSGALHQAEALMLADYPVALLTFDRLNRLVSPRLKGVPDGITYPQSRYLSFATP